jgi:hypothetical protein
MLQQLAVSWTSMVGGHRTSVLNGKNLDFIGRPFQPGQSGNPGGRPKRGTTFTDIIRALPDEEKEAVVQQMLKLAKQGNVDPKARDWSQSLTSLP